MCRPAADAREWEMKEVPTICLLSESEQGMELFRRLCAHWGESIKQPEGNVQQVQK